MVTYLGGSILITIFALGGSIVSYNLQFCKLHNISRGSIYKWRKYFLDDQNDFDGSGDFISLSVNDRKLSSSSQEFIKINSPLKMTSRSGVVIELNSGCNISELKSIMEALNATK